MRHDSWRQGAGTGQHRRRWARYLMLWALCQVLSGAGCDACARATDPDPPERQAYRRWQRYNSPEWLAYGDAEDRARQAAADRYRDRIVPGLGCEKCPNWCKLVDLRPIDHREFARQFRQTLIDRRSPDGVERATSVIEHNRLTCILKIHESMKSAMGPLLHPREHPMVRFEAALLSVGFHLWAGDPESVLFELAEGQDRAAVLARRLIAYWDREGWPDEPYVPDIADANRGEIIEDAMPGEDMEENGEDGT